MTCHPSSSRGRAATRRPRRPHACLRRRRRPTSRPARLDPREGGDLVVGVRAEAEAGVVELSALHASVGPAAPDAAIGQVGILGRGGIGDLVAPDTASVPTRSSARALNACAFDDGPCRRCRGAHRRRRTRRRGRSRASRLVRVRTASSNPSSPDGSSAAWLPSTSCGGVASPPQPASASTPTSATSRRA